MNAALLLNEIIHYLPDLFINAMTMSIKSFYHDFKPFTCFGDNDKSNKTSTTNNVFEIVPLLVNHYFLLFFLICIKNKNK